MELFTDEWARAWRDRLNDSPTYREAAAEWEGAVVLEEAAAGGGVSRAVFLDLHHGTCREARAARPRDRERARYALAASENGWKRVLDGMSPIAAILRGKLKVTKGSVASLLPFTRAANELVEAARGIDAPAGRRPDATGQKSAGVEALPAATPERAQRRVFRTTGVERLDFTSLPMQLWEKAKALGTWNPSDIDFTQDRIDWVHLDADERDLLLRLASLFQAGEESVVLDLLPLIEVVADEGRLEEEMYLTSFLWEEAKHVEVFARFFEAVGESDTHLSGYHTPSYRRIFCEALPDAMARLRTDPSAVAQARASVTYNLIVEGVLAETGYHTYHEVLTGNGILPGMQRVTRLLKQDESRHLAYGVHLLSRLVREHGDVVWTAIETRMDELLEPALGIIHEAFAAYDPDRIPFALSPEHFVDFAQAQFEKRLEHVERART